MLNDLANALDAFLSNSPRHLVKWYAARGPLLVEARGGVFAVAGAGLRGRDWSRKCRDPALGMCHPAKRCRTMEKMCVGVGEKLRKQHYLHFPLR
jgi:hypothetical protein